MKGLSSAARRMVIGVALALCAGATALYALPCCDSNTIYYDQDPRYNPNANEVGEHFLLCDGSQDNWGVHSNYATVHETNCTTGAETGSYCIIDGTETVC